MGTNTPKIDKPGSLTDLMRQKFPSTLDGKSEPLTVGVFEVTGFRIVDSEKFEKQAYIDTTSGQKRTTSKNVIGSLNGEVGKSINELLQTHTSVRVEIVDKVANTGRKGIAIKAF